MCYRVSDLKWEQKLFLTVPGGDESIALNKTNIVTVENWGKGVINTVKSTRGCGNDVALPKFKKQKTAETADQSTANVPAQSIPQPKDGAPSPSNHKKKKLRLRRCSRSLFVWWQTSNLVWLRRSKNLQRRGEAAWSKAITRQVEPADSRTKLSSVLLFSTIQSKLKAKLKFLSS